MTLSFAFPRPSRDRCCVYCLRRWVLALGYAADRCPGCGADLETSAGTVDVEGPRDAVNVRGPGQKPSQEVLT